MFIIVYSPNPLWKCDILFFYLALCEKVKLFFFWFCGLEQACVMFTSTVVFSFGKWGWDYWGLTQVQEVVWIIWRDHLRCLSCFSQVTLQWSTALNTHSICLNYTTAPLLSFLKVQNMPVGLMYFLESTEYASWLNVQFDCYQIHYMGLLYLALYNPG